MKLMVFLNNFIDMKRNMESVLEAIQNRLKIDAGYAGNSYDLLGFT